MIEKEYPNSYIRGLAWFLNHRGNTTKKEKEKPSMPVCTLSEIQMRDIGAVSATVVNTSPESSFIEIEADAPLGKTLHVEAFDHTKTLKSGDKIIVTVRKHGHQTTTHILGREPDINGGNKKCH